MITHMYKRQRRHQRKVRKEKEMVSGGAWGMGVEERCLGYGRLRWGNEVGEKQIHRLADNISDI